MAALLLLSPLALYAQQGTMPLPGLYAVAAGIATSLALVGRRLHAVLLSDALGRRGDRGRALMTVGLMLGVALLVVLGIVVGLVLVARTALGGRALP